MIREIGVKNFKCFEELRLPVRQVNILTGLNGMGKSTMIQSLLLLRQSCQADGAMKGLHLDGDYVCLGNGQDVLYEKAREEKLGAEVTLDKGTCSYEFQYIPDSDFLPLIGKQEAEGEEEFFGQQLSYLSAYPIEPRESYRITNEEMLGRKDFRRTGEFSLQYLNLYGDSRVENPHIVLQDKAGDSLLNQTRVWMDRISPGVSPRVLINMSLRASELRYEFIEGMEKTNSYKSMNVGFGITYVLPIIVAALASKEGDMLIVENPEAHIHPAGQRMLGELLARAGAGGVQIFAETHSDHIINGIRLAVKHGIISGEEIALDYFYKDQKYRHDYVRPEILSDGRLDCWPEGFFDEWDKALYELI